MPLALPGAMQGACTINAAALPVAWPMPPRKSVFGEDWMLGAGFRAQSTPLQCERRVRHPVLLLTRGDWWNPFHATEDFFNAFIVLAVHEVEASELQVIIADKKREGLLYELWQRAFSPNYPLTRLHEWTSSAGGGAVCFDKLLFQMPHASCAICNPVGRDSGCGYTPLATRYANFILAGMGLPLVSAQREACGSAINVTLISRRKKKEGKRGGAMRASMSDETEMSILSGVSRSGGHGEVVLPRRIDFGTLGVREQLAAARSSSVLIGMHGAALTHALMMPPGSAVVEMQRGANFHYHNIAKRAGHFYFDATSPQAAGELIGKAVRAVLNARCG